MKLIGIFLLLPIGLSAQKCWQCLSYAERDLQEEVLTTCRAVANCTASSQERAVAQFVLARQHMNDAAYNKAVPLLDSVRTSGIPLLSWMASGLKGDCLLDLGKQADAAALYEEVAKTCDNDYFAPYYLFKAGKIHTAQKKPKEAYIAFKTILNRYPDFAQQLTVSAYIDPGLDRELALNEPRIPQKLPASPMGPGYVYDQKIDPAGLKAATDYIIAQETVSRQQMGLPMDEQTLQMAADRGWQYYTEGMITRKALAETGLSAVSEQELHAYLFGEYGYAVMPDIAANFSDAGGQLDKAYLQLYIDNMQAQNDGLWQTVQRALTDQLDYEKYYKLMGLGAFVTRWEAVNDDLRRNTVMQVTMAFSRYQSPGAAESPFSEKDIEQYYRQHIAENRYDKPAGKDLLIVRIAPVPGHEDTVAFLAQMESLKEEWKKAASDSLFVARHIRPNPESGYRLTLRSDADQIVMRGKTFPAAMEKAFTTAKAGDFIGPYIEENAFCLAKVHGFNENLISARHILISSNKWDSPEDRRQKKEQAQELLKEVSSDNFARYVERYTDDPGSKATGGTYNDFLATDMVKSFGDYCATAPIGKIGLVETEFGFHIVEVLRRGKAHYPICSIIRKELKPDEGAAARALKEAEDLNARYLSLAAGKDDAAKVAQFTSLTQQYSPRKFQVLDNAPFIHGLREASVDEVLKLLYGKNPAVGKTVITTDGDEALLIVVTGICDGTNIPYSAVRDEMKQRMEKEAQESALELSASRLSDIGAIAAKWGTTAEQRELTGATLSIMGIGYEPDIVSTLFRSGNPGDLMLIGGNTGICAVRIHDIAYPPKQSDYEDTRLQLQYQATAMLTTLLRSASRDHIIDNRRLDALGLR